MSNYLNYIMISVYIFQGGIDVLTDELMERHHSICYWGYWLMRPKSP